MTIDLRVFHVWIIGGGMNPDLEDHAPENPELDSFEFEIEIGPAEGETGDIFRGRFATRRKLEHARKTIMAAQWYLPDYVFVLDHYEFGALMALFVKTVKNCEDKTWLHSVRNLMEYFQWEFAGMHKEKEGDLDAEGNVSPQGVARQHEIEPLPWERKDWVE